MKPEDCTHEQFGAVVNVYRMLDTGTFMADVSIKCATCDVPMRFVGVPAGVNFERPMCSITGDELHAPIEPAYVTELHKTASFTMPKPPTRN